MGSPDPPLFAAALERRERDGEPAAVIASAVAATWRDIEAALTSIIGVQGVAALYKRSLALASRAHPCLLEPAATGSTVIDLTALTAALGQQTSNDAASAGGDFLQTFYGLVESLIGPSLTHRLLRKMTPTP